MLLCPKIEKSLSCVYICTYLAVIEFKIEADASSSGAQPLDRSTWSTEGNDGAVGATYRGLGCTRTCKCRCARYRAKIRIRTERNGASRNTNSERRQHERAPKESWSGKEREIFEAEKARARARARETREQAAERDSKGAQQPKRGLLVIIMTKAPGKHPFNLLAYRHAVVPTIHTTYDRHTTTNRL